jgi:hypothetical protein
MYAAASTMPVRRGADAAPNKKHCVPGEMQRNGRFCPRPKRANALNELRFAALEIIGIERQFGNMTSICPGPNPCST